MSKNKAAETQAKYDDDFKKKQEQDAHKVMEESRTIMVMSSNATHAFFAALVMKLVYKPSWEVKATATDGKVMLYNPEYMALKPRDMLRAIHAKGVIHCAMEHPQMLATMKHLDEVKLQLAMELVANQILKGAGFSLPPDSLLPGKGDFKKVKEDMATLEAYRQIPDSTAKKYAGQLGNLSGLGGVLEAMGGKGSEAELEEMSQTWKINTSMAQQAAKQRGTISANMQLWVDTLLAPKVPWRQVLREWATRRVKTDYSWAKLNRRHVARGIYLPSMSGESISGLIIANDTSGSMGHLDARSACAVEIMAIAEQMKCKITVLHHDSAVCGVQEWESADGPLKLEPKGGGGTSHHCVTDWIEKHASFQENEVAGLLCLTDGYSSFPADPGYPTIWAIINNKGFSAPFGTTIHIDEDER